MKRIFFAGILAFSTAVVQAQDAGYQKEVTVSAETRLDWTFALANQSLVSPPAEWLEQYDSRQQRYELYVPFPNQNFVKQKPRGTRPIRKSNAAGKTKVGKSGSPNPAGFPFVLFISPGNQPGGWSQMRAVCEQQGILFASPYEAGNNVPMPKRVRIVLDVLDDVRRKHNIDPDRTYIGGFSGGGRTACGIAFALPELFGGVLPVCAGGDLREEIWLRHRVIERLSVAMITGTEDFNRGEVERFRGPLLTDIGVRTKVTVVPKLGHAIPDSKTFENVLLWLDAGVDTRRQLAVLHPASRIQRDAAPDRQQWAQLLFTEGQNRLKKPTTLYAGLMLLQGVSQRWPDLKVAEDAKTILLEYEARPDHPWEKDDIAEQRKFLIARARGLSSYATGDLPPQYAKQRNEMLQAAINLWTLVIQDGQDAKAVAEGEKRLPELKARLEAE